MLDFLRYLSAARRYRQSHALGFLRMGLGIKVRQQQYAECWSSHIQCCKKVQEEWAVKIAEEKEKYALAVLGAGRLYDFDGSSFSKIAARISFVDADALCLPIWKRWRRAFPKLPVEYHILEMTGVLERWRAELQEATHRGSLEDTLSLLDGGADPQAFSIEENVLTGFFLRTKPEAVLSLNVLSQLAVMWQDIVERELQAAYGKQQVHEQEEQWLQAYSVSARRLIRAHLTALNESGAERLLLITDVEYVYFPRLKGRSAESPLLWKEGEPETFGIRAGSWEQNPACGEDGDSQWRERCYALDALLEVNIENPPLLQVVLPKYLPHYLGSWVWNICPDGDLPPGFGVLHRVAALEFSKRDISAADSKPESLP
jgi:hypothetical protein